VTTLVVLQPGYLPWLGYFDLLQKADVFVHYDDVQFDKHGWRNRNRVKGPKGAIWLTVPVFHSGRTGQSILDVEIDDRPDWRRKHLSTVAQSYARAPFIDTVLPRLRNIIERPWLRLVDLDLALIDWLAVEIRTRCWRRSQRATHQPLPSFRRDPVSLGQCGAGLSRRGAIRSRRHRSHLAHPSYAQQHGEFIPYLSVLDLILNVGRESLAVLSP
jgi:WbqC-like protein family